MKKEHIHLVPIIDAGVKQEEGYDVYEEGLEKDTFVRKKTVLHLLQLYGREKHCSRIC